MVSLMSKSRFPAEPAVEAPPQQQAQSVEQLRSAVAEPENHDTHQKVVLHSLTSSIVFSPRKENGRRNSNEGSQCTVSKRLESDADF